MGRSAADNFNTWARKFWQRTKKVLLTSASGAEQREAMDREPEDLQFLGIFGIVGEGFKILRSCAKLLGSLTVTLILPLCFAILGHQLVSEYLLYKIRWNELFYQLETGTPAGERIMKELTWQRTELFLFQTAYVVFVLVFSLLSTAAVVYTVASIYTAKEISYTRVMSIVPRVWKRLMGTFLWFFIFLFLYWTFFFLVTAFLFFLFFNIFTVDMHKFNLALFVFGLFLLTAQFCGYVYISMVWHLACVISVLEDKHGLGAIRKSKNLIKGNQITALVLDILYIVFVGIIGWFFGNYVLHGHHHGVSGAGRGSYGTVLVVLLCFVHLMGLLTQSVLYFVCKSYHHESIDKSSLSDHLEVYLGDYEPLKTSNIQMEYLHDSV